MEIPLDSYLPSPSDVNFIFDRCVKVVEHILVRRILSIHDVKVKPQVHEKSTEMSMQTNTFCGGVVKANPATTEGTIKIMEHINK